MIIAKANNDGDLSDFVSEKYVLSKTSGSKTFPISITTMTTRHQVSVPPQAKWSQL
jgi:hypothetical protein